MAATLVHAPVSPAHSRAPRSGWREAFRLKLYGLVALAALLLIGIQVYSVYRSYQQQLEAKTTEIRSITQAARSVLDRYAKLASSGQMPREQAEQTAYEALRSIRFGDNADYVFVWREKDAITLVHANAAQEGQHQFRAVVGNTTKEAIAAARVADMRANKGELVYSTLLARAGSPEPMRKQNIISLYEPWGVVVGTGVWLDRVEAEFHDELVQSAVLAIVVTLILVLGGVLIVRRVMRQLGGEPAGAVVVMQRAAEGDFTGSASNASAPGSLLAAFGAMSQSIRGMIVNVRDEAGSLSRDANRLSESVHQVSAATASQSEATASMAAAIEELTVSVSHISEAALETEKLSEGVAVLCRDSESQVNSASSGMQRIAAAVGEASEKIAGLELRAEQINVIAASIKEIASQTNLLALNAAIEAARAGEQGRGFSVVADEVRKLAERTASATIEIEQMVHAVQAETKDSTATMSRVRPIVEEGTSLTQHVAESLREIRHRADQTLERVREVAHATREQSSASTSIAQRVEGIAQMVEQTNAGMEETARSASDMRDMSVRLDTLVGTFKV
ncbi:methyl-accepting chemotaxis protein [Pigmentiphaga aceris]|uniref:Methyl-accepting chemotaxis protein n=1 Tax=Pigmentiphaga aceris TaxID=1940612 RepID=A0A5C0AWB8_9BURK|nr:methyl-accepting chemotaxis protein [Pigmentiphaga aceris]QEI04617.1 methyl-accepting chemotaxis protein [Pigmentiphaga aceris]